MLLFRDTSKAHLHIYISIMNDKIMYRDLIPPVLYLFSHIDMVQDFMWAQLA